MSGRNIALYIHIPFCATKCPYCDFNTYEGIDNLISPYTQALEQEIRLWGETLTSSLVSTVFFGGGTPSYLTVAQTRQILSSVRSSFTVVPGSETTLEVNPDDVTEQNMKNLLELGINRLSIGVQSLDDRLLKLLGRRHTAQQAITAYRQARQAGFDRLSIDLMYGLPQQTMDQWQTTLEKALDLQMPHISLYCLTLEKGTPMERWVVNGTLPDPDDDLAAEMYMYAEHILKQSGYSHYEISNWSLPDYECQHNLTYWNNQSYLGVGPGAHSYIDGYRFHQVKSPRSYIDRVHRWANRGAQITRPLNTTHLQEIETLENCEAVDTKLEMTETVFLGLRLMAGLNTRKFQHRFGISFMEVYNQQVTELSELGLLEQVGSVLRLTPKGIMLSNQVFVRFM